MNDDKTLSLSETAKGIGIRAGLLAVGGLLITGWLVALATKVAGAAIHLMLVLGAGLIGAGLITYKVHELEKSREQPQLG
jgi:high-affinity Fe2+/Pb2+ permease